MSIEKSSSVCHDGSLDCTEPVAKRTRYANKQQLELEKLKDELSNYEPTVLDVLNEDCWRIILDKVNLQDLVRSERVSRCWRSMVLRYIQGIHLNLQSGRFIQEVNSPRANYRIMKVPAKRFMPAIAKFGPAIVAADCSNGTQLRALYKHSPRIEELMIRYNHFQRSNDKIVPFEKLRRIGIYAYNFNDRDVSKFLRSPTIEELIVHENYNMSGSCLKDLKLNLKSLEVHTCFELNINHLIASERLSELTKLELSNNHLLSLENVHKLLEKTPKLEYLGFRSMEASDYAGFLEWEDAICRLSMLKHLNLFSNEYVSDSLLEAVGRCCGQLHTVSVGKCRSVSGVGLVNMCRGAGQTLTALDASFNERISSKDVAACISHCPNLEIFNVRHCPAVGQNIHVIEGAVIQSSPRACPLRLQLTKHKQRLEWDSDGSDDFSDSDDSFFGFLSDFDYSDDTDRSDSPPMEVCSDLILDFNSNIFKCGDSSVDPDWETDAF